MCMTVCLHVSLYPLHMSSDHRGQKVALDAMVMSHHVGARNQTLVLGKNMQ